MTKGTLLAGIGIVAIGATALFMDQLSEQRAYEPRTEELQEPAKRGIHQAMEYNRMLRANVNTGQVEIEDAIEMRKAVMAKAASQGQKAVGLQWIEMGPDNVGGRTRAITINPNNPSEIWCGGVSGGLFKSEDGANLWQHVESFDQGLNTNAAGDNVNVASICFAGNGDILVGTGSLFDGSFGGGGSGFIGGGLYRSTDDGATWQLLKAPAQNWVGNVEYVFIDEIWAIPGEPNKVYVGHNRGLDIWDLTTETFSPAPGLPTNLACGAMAMSVDGQTILAVMANDPWLSTDGGSSWTNISNNIAPQVGIGRTEVAISPDNPDYMYVLAANGSGAMINAYGSSDRGQTWNPVWPNPVPQAMDIFGSNTQGGYDNVIEVVPGHPDQFWAGGVTLWRGNITGQPVQIAQGSSDPGCFNCVHVDVHEITWDRVNNIAYVGCDGGVYTGFTSGGNEVFIAANRGLNITQFYGIGIGHNGKVLGGTQDNSTPYLSLNNPNSIQEAVVLFGGDGFDCDISNLDPNILFATSQNGNLGRSADNGQNFADFYSDRLNSVAFSNGNLGDFFTTVRLWETYDDPNSPNTTGFNNIGTDTVFAGEIFEYRGRNTSIPLFAEATSTILPDSVINGLPDRVQSLFAAGFTGAQGVWVTRDALAINLPADWWQVTGDVGNVNALEWSYDGCHLFVGSTGGDVYAISGFCNAYDSASADITALPVNGSAVDTANVNQTWLRDINTGDTVKLNQASLDYSTRDFVYVHDSTPVTYNMYVRRIFNGSTVITDLSVDKNDPNHLVFTVGGYGGSGKVRESTNALATFPTFSNIWNPGSALNGMPVYTAVIHVDDPDIIVAGTEWGIFATDNGGATWTMENDGGIFVPIYDLRQQRNNWQTPHWFGPDWIENPGVIYAGTHGRGFFRTETLLSVDDVLEEPSADVLDELIIFPNPSTNVTTFRVDLAERTNVTAVIYDLNGRFVKEASAGFLSAGEQQVQFDVSDMANGTYVLHLAAGADVQIGRFVVQR